VLSGFSAALSANLACTPKDPPHAGTYVPFPPQLARTHPPPRWHEHTCALTPAYRHPHRHDFAHVCMCISSWWLQLPLPLPATLAASPCCPSWGAEPGVVLQPKQPQQCLKATTGWVRWRLQQQRRRPYGSSARWRLLGPVAAAWAQAARAGA